MQYKFQKCSPVIEKRFWKANFFYIEMQLEMEQEAFYKDWN